MWVARVYIRVNRSTRTVLDFFARVGTALLVQRFFELAGGVWILLPFVVFSLFMGAKMGKDSVPVACSLRDREDQIPKRPRRYTQL